MQQKLGTKLVEFSESNKIHNSTVQRTGLTRVVDDRNVHDVGVRVLNARPVQPGHFMRPLNRPRSLVRPVDEFAELRQAVRSNQTGHYEASVASGAEVHRLNDSPVEVGPVEPTGVKVYREAAHSTEVVEVRRAVRTVQCGPLHASLIHPVAPVQIPNVNTAPVGSVAQWLGRCSLAGGLSLTCAYLRMTGDHFVGKLSTMG